MNRDPRRTPPDKQVNATPPLPGEPPRVVMEYGDGRITIRYHEKEGGDDCTAPRKPRISWL